MRYNQYGVNPASAEAVSLVDLEESRRARRLMVDVTACATNQVDRDPTGSRVP